MTISLFTRCRSVALPPRLGAVLALTAFLSLGAGARDARALVITTPTYYAEFAFTFDTTLSLPIGSATLLGSGVLDAKRLSTDPAGQWLVYNVTGGSLFIKTSEASGYYGLGYASPNTFPTPTGNDNLVFPYASAPHQLDSLGITFALTTPIFPTIAYLNIKDPPETYNFSIGTPDGDFFTGGTGAFQAPGPTPGAGLAAFAFLLLAGAAGRARGLLAR